MNKNLKLMAIVSLVTLAGCSKSEERISIIDFEELVPGIEGYWNGSGGEEGFISGNGLFVNFYDDEWDFWSGFSYSDHSDNLSGDYTNMFSSVTGSGDEGSEIYSTYYYMNVADTLRFFEPQTVDNISVANSTYAYMTMLNGNLFAKKFGGEDGTDPDWFRLKLTAIDTDGKPSMVYNIYLADFRSDNDANDYISNQWNRIDMSESGYIYAIVFEIESSDTGDYGINTPAYVCIDNIEGRLIPLE